MKDVEKTNIEREKNGKRMRRRRRSMNTYIAVVLALALATFVAMSYTFLFNIQNMVVVVTSGENSETEEEANIKGNQVADASGIKIGDNLLRINLEKSAEKILSDVLFVETAEVNRSFPSTLEITVSYCVPSFNVEYDGGVLVVSKMGKILEKNNFITDGLPTISGINPLNVEAGQQLSAEEEHKNVALTELMASVDTDSGISGIDISDEFSIVINYSNGTIFKMGNWNDADYKLTLADTVMHDVSVNGKKGYLTMVGSNQCAFRSSNDPAGLAGTEQQYPTDAEGNTIIPEIKDESNPEQEAIFSEFNSRSNENNTENSGEDIYGYTTEPDYNNYDYSYDYNYNYDYNDEAFNWGNDGW
ncbi:MAG: FtsQ-type POTRA domain-containing protein [Ruminococcus sp.]|nr:FtsQ-type POTRA domain-containing protein [Ruminococcus sp.]